MTRYLVGLLASIVVAIALFQLMRVLIHMDPRDAADDRQSRRFELVEVREDAQAQIKRRKPDPPPPPQTPPPTAPQVSFDPTNTSGIDVSAGPVQVDANVNLVGGSGFSSDGDYLPIVKVAPQYPRRALERGIEGYVLLEFTVTPQGTVKDPRVVEANPQNVFDQAAIQAALKFKYKPKVVDGEPIEVPGVRNRITFELEK